MMVFLSGLRLGNSVGGTKRRIAMMFGISSSEYARPEVDHDAVCVSRDGHAGDDDEVHAELNATTDGLEEAHCKATALSQSRCHEGNAVDDGGPTDGVPNCSSNCDANKVILMFRW